MSTLICVHPGTVRRVPAAAKYKLARPLEVEATQDKPMWSRLGGADRAIPTLFSVRAVLEEPPCIVDLVVRIDESNAPAVDQMTVTRTGDHLDPGPPVTGGMVRRLAVDALLREAVEEIAEPTVTAKVEGFAGSFQLQRDLDAGVRDQVYVGRRARQPRPPATRRPVTDETLRRVAEIYRAASNAPTQAVADELHVSRSHAGRLVGQSRSAGHLAPTTPGKAGEQR